MLTRRHGYAAVLAVVALFILELCSVVSPAAADLVDVDHADDICAPSDDPCVITERVVPIEFALLDFGTRTVLVQGDGLLDIGTMAVEMRAGDVGFSTGSAPAVRLGRGPSDPELFNGGYLNILARGTCSDDPAVLCTKGTQCGSGVCDATSGDVDLGGMVDGDSSGLSSEISVFAAGDVAISQPIHVSTNDPESDGGVIVVLAQGNVESTARLIARGGRDGQGGEIELTAGGDLLVSGVLNANGGDFDGGFVCLEAAGDITLAAVIHASSTAGEGFGGEVRVYAEGDLSVAPRTKIRAQGHRQREGFGGDGGLVEMRAIGAIAVSAKTLIDVRPAAPDGFAGDVDIDADGRVNVAAKIRADSRGRLGGGGVIVIESRNADTVVTRDARLSVKGHLSGAGDIDIFANTSLTLDGTLNVTGRSGGLGGRVLGVADRLNYLGKIRGGGQDFDGINGCVDFAACDVTVENGSDIRLRGEFDEATFDCREQCTIEAGARVRLQDSGSVVVRRRPDGPPAIIEGNVRPAVQIVDSYRAPCVP